MKGMIKMSLRTLLDIATEEGFNELAEMEVGSDKYNNTAKILNEMSNHVSHNDQFAPASFVLILISHRSFDFLLQLFAYRSQ